MFKKHPDGVIWILGIEVWERFSYYGMRALLFLFMVNGMMFTKESSGAIYGWYTGLVYAFPVLGGIIADRYIGYKKAVLYGGCIMVLGHVCMALGTNISFFLAMGLIIVGNGLFKPNAASLLGSLYEKDDIRRDSGFTLYYMSANIGATISPLVCGYVGERYGWHYGFALAGVGMAIGVVLYWLSPLYGKTSKMDVSDTIIGTNTISRPLASPFMFILMFIACICFFIAFEQAGSSLTLFAESSVNRSFFDFTIPVSYFQSVNPLFVILLAPLFSVMWLRLGAFGKEPSIMSKLSIGLGTAGIGYLIIYFISRSNSSIHFGWLIILYLFLTIAELCISPVAISAVTKLAPEGKTSMYMGIWFGGVFVANVAAGYLSTYYQGGWQAIYIAVPLVLFAFGLPLFESRFTPSLKKRAT